eukprot:449394-Rhodomonas_salina.1
MQEPGRRGRHPRPEPPLPPQPLTPDMSHPLSCTTTPLPSHRPSPPRSPLPRAPLLLCTLLVQHAAAE